jgi:hypothetical protein
MAKGQCPPKCLYGSIFVSFGAKSLFSGGKFVHDIYGNPNSPQEDKFFFQNLYKFHNLYISIVFYLILSREVCPRSSRCDNHSVKRSLVEIGDKTSLDTFYKDLRGASHYGRGVKKTSDKLPSREQGRSPLKYINYKFYISLERKVCLLKESLGFHKYCGHVFLHWTNFWHQNSQKMLPCICFGGPCLLAFGL